MFKLILCWIMWVCVVVSFERLIKKIMVVNVVVVISMNSNVESG